MERDFWLFLKEHLSFLKGNAESHQEPRKPDVSKIREILVQKRLQSRKLKQKAAKQGHRERKILKKELGKWKLFRTGSK